MWVCLWVFAEVVNIRIYPPTHHNHKQSYTYIHPCIYICIYIHIHILYCFYIHTYISYITIYIANIINNHKHTQYHDNTTDNTTDTTNTQPCTPVPVPFQMSLNGQFYLPPILPITADTDGTGDGGYGDGDGGDIDNGGGQSEHQSRVRHDRRERLERLERQKQQQLTSQDLIKYAGLTGAQMEKAKARDRDSSDNGIGGGIGDSDRGRDRGYLGSGSGLGLGLGQGYLNKRGLRVYERDRLEKLLAGLSTCRVDICAVMVFCIECMSSDGNDNGVGVSGSNNGNRHSNRDNTSNTTTTHTTNTKQLPKDPSSVMMDIVSILTSTILTITLPWSNKIAILYTIHDILSNTDTNIVNVGRFRGMFQTVLPEIFYHFGVCYRSHVSGRMTAKNVSFKCV